MPTFIYRSDWPQITFTIQGIYTIHQDQQPTICIHPTYSRHYTQIWPQRDCHGLTTYSTEREMYECSRKLLYPTLPTPRQNHQTTDTWKKTWFELTYHIQPHDSCMWCSSSTPPSIAYTSLSLTALQYTAHLDNRYVSTMTIVYALNLTTNTSTCNTFNHLPFILFFPYCVTRFYNHFTNFILDQETYNNFMTLQNTRTWMKILHKSLNLYS
jgi:hypothetical protein